MSLKSRSSKGRSSERMQNKDKMIPSWRIRVKGSTYDNNKLKTFLSKRHVESCHTLYSISSSFFWKTKVKGILFHLLFFVLVVIFTHKFLFVSNAKYSGNGNSHKHASHFLPLYSNIHANTCINLSTLPHNRENVK